MPERVSPGGRQARTQEPWRSSAARGSDAAWRSPGAISYVEATDRAKRVRGVRGEVVVRVAEHVLRPRPVELREHPARGVGVLAEVRDAVLHVESGRMEVRDLPAGRAKAPVIEGRELAGPARLLAPGLDLQEDLLRDRLGQDPVGHERRPPQRREEVHRDPAGPEQPFDIVVELAGVADMLGQHAAEDDVVEPVVLAGAERTRAHVADKRRVAGRRLAQLGLGDVHHEAFEIVRAQEVDVERRPRAASQLAHLATAELPEPSLKALGEVDVRPYAGRDAERSLLDDHGATAQVSVGCRRRSSSGRAADGARRPLRARGAGASSCSRPRSRPR